MVALLASVLFLARDLEHVGSVDLCGESTGMVGRKLLHVQRSACRTLTCSRPVTSMVAASAATLML